MSALHKDDNLLKQKTQTSKKHLPEAYEVEDTYIEEHLPEACEVEDTYIEEHLPEACDAKD